MGRIFDKLKKDHPAYRLEPVDGGFMLVRKENRAAEFNEFARELINYDGQDVAVFPTPDGGRGYERLFLLPL